MAINTIEFAKIMQNNLDQAAVREATSGWMVKNAGQVKYNGGDEVKIPTMSTVGLADYDRDEGFVQGGVTVKHETYKMTQDRGRTFQLDAMDVDESGFVATAANTIKIFQSEHIIPEIDSYRYSKIHSIAETAGQTEKITLTSDNVLAKLQEHVMAVKEKIGYGSRLIITLPGSVWALLNNSTAFGRSINLAEFKQGNLNTQVYSLNGDVIRLVPADRFKTKYVSQDGKTGGQEAGGLKPAGDAKDINWIICPETTPIAISKTDKLRVFAPNVNQKADAWKIDFRLYHDLWILKGKERSIFTSTKGE